MKPEDIGALVAVGQPRVAPDGQTIAYVVTTVDVDANEYQRQVWLASADASSPPRPLTAGTHKDGLPRWSPNGERLAFVSHRRGPREGCELYVLPLGGGEPLRVLEWPEEITELAWSPDGARLAFVARHRNEAFYLPDRDADRPPRQVDVLQYRLDNEGFTIDRRQQLFVVETAGGEPVAVTGGPHDHSALSWSADGSRLAFSASRQEGWDLGFERDLFAAAADGSEAGQPEQLTETERAYAFPSYSPDGGQLAYLVEESRVTPSNSQVGVLDLASGTKRILSDSLDRQCAPYPGAREPVWHADGLLFAVEDDGNVHLYTAPADASAEPELLVGGDRAVQAFDAAGGVVAFCAGGPTALAELFVLDADGNERRLTDHTSSFTERVDLAEPQPFTATSTDGTEVHCWVIPPIGAKPGVRYPTLLNVHGGPFTQYKNDFFDEFQMQARAGFAVVYCNPRGSSGRSEAWGRAIRGPKAAEEPGSGWGGVDADDVLAAIDEACRQFDFIDPKRLGMLGGSYGGYMASWLAGHTDRFKAYCSERAVNDYIALEIESDFAGLFQHEVGVSHLDDPDEWRRQSPITYVREIRAPMLILHSESDLRCPIGQAEALFVALRMLGKPVEFWRFPGEGHELSRSGAPKHRIRRAEIILDFFQRHL
jgi:dipeptidyl aminopeptidase/acylaminoacyl peptidase